METIHIENGKQVNVSANFTMQEIYNSTNPRQAFDCPVALIAAIQVLRNWIGKPVICSSTYRHPDAYGAGSAHDEGLAIDCYSKAVDMITPYNTEVMNYIDGKGSNLIEQLRFVGIDGFGIEGGCIHLDCGGYGIRKGRKKHTDKWGDYSAFEWRPAQGINRSL